MDSAAWTLDKKERLLQVAAELFTEYGVRNTSVEQIAKGAKVGKGTMYLYFADKEALFAEVLARKWAEMSRNAASAMSPSMTFAEKLLHLLSHVTAARSADPFLVKMHTELKHYGTPEIERGLKRVQLEAIADVEAMVREGIETGQMPAGLPARMTAFMLVKAYAAFTYEWPKEYPAYAPEELEKLVVLLLQKKC
jgi:AcrR family transcriptional regulator